MSATATNTKSTPKAPKKSRIVKIPLPPDVLQRFPSDAKPRSSAALKHEPSTSTPLPDGADKSSDSNATPASANGNDAADNNSLAPPKTDGRKKRGGAAVTGRKRAPPSIDPNAPPRERGRPGPKKKPRLPDGTIDRTGDDGAPAAVVNKVPAHKLGPKANTGAINAGLRALDRSGKPCRRWAKNTLQLKSFTGTVWVTPSWKGASRDTGFAGDVKSDSTGSSEVKPMPNSSAPPSERSQGGLGDTAVMHGMESSPAPPVAA